MGDPFEGLDVVDDEQDPFEGLDVVASASPPAPTPAVKQGPSEWETAGAMFGHGASLGASDEAMGAGYGVREKLPKALGGVDPVTRISRGVGGQPTGVSSVDAGMAGRRAELAEHRETNPGTATAFEALGAGAVTAPLSIAAAPATTGALVAEGAALGGVYAANESEDPTVAGRLREGAEAAAFAGPANAIIPGAAAQAKRGLSAIARGAGEVASRRRLGATGAYGPDVADFVRAKGMPKADAVARRMEEKGLGGVQSWQSVSRKAPAVMDEAGQRIGELNEAASAAGVRVDMGPIADALEAEGQRISKLSRLPEVQREAAEFMERAASLRNTRRMTPEQAAQRADAIMNRAVEQSNALIDAARGKGKAAGDAALQQAQQVFSDAEAKAARVVRTAQYPDEVPFAQAHGLRKWLDSKVWSNERASFANPKAGEDAERFRELAGSVRRQIDEGLSGAGASDIAGALKDANLTYESAAFALNASSKRAAREAGNWPLSPASSVVGAAGGGLGMAGGDGASALLTAGSSALAAEGVKRYGNASLATLARGVERGGAALAAPRTAAAPVTSAVRRGAVAEGASMSAPMSLSPADALAAIDQDPNAFGPQTEAVRQAALSGDPRAVTLAMMSR